jgi:predicted enzyme related to lactoylglutathione lyase
MAITATKPRTNARQDLNNFWWADLQAKDLQAALDFYGRVLGWEFRQEHDDAGSMVYHTAHVGGVKLAGVGEMQQQAREGGMPSVWTDYVSVADADATCAKAVELGGTVMMPAMDVLDQGRMAIIVDPTGAAFGVWQGAKHTGADAVNQPASITWVELYSSDVAATKAFYGSLFGWTFDQSPEALEAGQEYWLASTAEGAMFAGLMPKPTEMAQAPDMWVTYFGVADVEAAKREVEAAGGSVLWGPMKTGPGRSIGFTDSQGGMATLMQLDRCPTD